MGDNNSEQNADIEATRDWYTNNRMLYERLSDGVRLTLLSAITHAGIPFLDVTARAKTLESFGEKIGRKGYSDPQSEMTDLAGIRVIAFIESDVERICDLIGKAFKVHPDKSLDKRKELGKDRFGYRSVHFVCELGENRVGLPENEPYKDRVFEIQVRTVLQHAWAEVEHDRGYKFAENLPAEIERRLYAQAAILESVDQEFNRIAIEIDNYAAEVKKKTAKGELDIEITTNSLMQYLDTLQKKHRGIRIKTDSATSQQKVAYDHIIKDANTLGLETIKDLDAYFTADFLNDASVFNRGLYSPSIVRVAFMYANLENYFEKCKPNWSYATTGFVAPLEKKYGADFVKETLKKHGIPIGPPKLPDVSSGRRA